MTKVNVKVPQSDGEISIAIVGKGTDVYKVSDGSVSVPEEKVDRFIAAVDGSKVSGGTSTGPKKES